MRAKQPKARDLTRRKTVLESSILPGKLADCSNEEPSQTEMFIVEGDSAGGSAKQGRDRNNQAILPLRGKILNVEKARLDKILSNEEIKALIAAIGAGIGEEFDVQKVRYHKIILMTDADVDGSHIRTLLLTFFFRYMTPLIESGYLYIAQPPLYKAKIGKKEQYLKDNNALKQFLFDWAQEQTTLAINNKKLAPESWNEFLALLSAYDDQLNHIGQRFNVSNEQAHQLAMTLYDHPWNKDEGTDPLIALLKNQFPDYGISYTEPTIEGDEQELKKPAHGSISFALRNVRWEAPISFFYSSEVKKSLELLKPLIDFEQHEWALEIIGKEKGLNNKGITRLINGIAEISRPFMSIQRYKGLGEMNAEQLWETAMDSQRRTLLKVTVQDALEADRWFTILMGDDVGGRKDYIERYGHFAKNLDV